MGKQLEKEEIVNGFAQYFVESIQSLKHDCIYYNGDDVYDNRNDENMGPMQNLFIPKITPEITRKLIYSMKTDKSPGSDGIRMRDLRAVADNIAEPLCYLINRSISQGIFPDVMKKSIIRPIYKNKSKKEFKNYRPIAILSSLDKIIEKYVLDCLNKYLKENNILSNKQFGFRQKCSTEQALEEFSQRANYIMENKIHGLGLFIDFSKAFDTVEHKHILSSLYKIGVRGHFLKWFQSYLNDRKLIVKVLNSTSEEKDVRYGVPQGSQLGPVLFIIYLNELLNMIHNCYIWAYADDVLLLAHDKNLQAAEEKLQNDFITLSRWVHDRGLIINNQKTCLMHICQKNMKTNRELCITYHSCKCLNGGDQCQCESVTIVKETKYLGMLVDNKLTWKAHITSLHKKLRPCVAAMYKLQYKTTNPVKLAVYKALFESLLRYGITVWGSAADGHLNLIKNLQKNCLNALYANNNLNQYEIENMNEYCMFGQLTPKGMYELSMITKQFNVHIYKTPYIRTFNSRNIIKYAIPVIRTNYGRRLYEYIVPYLYNLLPDEIENITYFKKFKKAVSLWIRTQRIA